MSPYFPLHAVSAEQADIDKGNLMVAKAGVGQAQASLEQAQLNLGFTEIRASIVGHIDRHMVDVGNLVTADTTLLTTLYQWDPMWAYFTVPEVNYLEYIKRQREKLQEVPPEAATRGKPASSPATPPKSAESQHVPSAAETRNPVEVGLANETGYPHEGYIDFAQPTVEPISGTLLIRGVFANPEPYVLRAGLFVRVRVPVGTQSAALLVPDTAIGTDQAGNYLLMVGPDDVVQRRSVTSGTREAQCALSLRACKPASNSLSRGCKWRGRERKCKSRRRISNLPMFSRFFIERPIFANVIAIITMLIGAVAYPAAGRPVSGHHAPDVQVTTTYPGAERQVVADTVAAPIEQQVNGVPGMIYMETRQPATARTRSRSPSSWAPTSTSPRCSCRTASTSPCPSSRRSEAPGRDHRQEASIDIILIVVTLDPARQAVRRPVTSPTT